MPRNISPRRADHHKGAPHGKKNGAPLVLDLSLDAGAASDPSPDANTAPNPILTTFPVARRGRIVAAVDAGTTYVLTYVQGEAAITLLHKRVDDFNKIVQAAAVAAGKQMVRPVEIIEKGKGGQRASGLGVVYNLAQFTFSLGQAIVTCRPCVTLCVFENAFKSRDSDEKPAWKTYSKFWARFILAKHPDSERDDNLALNLSTDALVEFDRDCEIIGNAILDALAEPYADVIAETLKHSGIVTKKLKIERQGGLSAFALGTREEDFDDFFDETKNGRALTRSIGDYSTARRLAEIGLKILDNKKLPASKRPSAADFGENTQFIVFERAFAERGLFLGRFEADQARFVGLAHFPETFEPTIPSKGKLSGLNRCPANIISAGLMSEYGTYF
jgi:hypothetical protein